MSKNLHAKFGSSSSLTCRVERVHTDKFGVTCSDTSRLDIIDSAKKL